MTKYQAYFVGSDGQVMHRRVFACYTDEEAIEWAKQLMDPWAVELWSGERMVKRLFPPDDKPTYMRGKDSASV